MNALLLFTLVATVAAATVATNHVPEVAKVAKVAKVAEVTETDEFEYDQDGVPLRTVPAARQSLTLGVIGPDDRLVSRINHNVAAAQFIIHNQDITFNGVYHTNITAIQVSRVGTTTHAIPSLKAGGLGKSFAVINILGVRGRAIDYQINIYASIGCATS